MEQNGGSCAGRCFGSNTKSNLALAIHSIQLAPEEALETKLMCVFLLQSVHLVSTQSDHRLNKIHQKDYS
ncbi:hypothetical protein Q9233_015780 [Columba guinea]|nr:hypothetical protein Q9233_015780 [Columba guinea]